jgi:hypothetical protein
VAECSDGHSMMAVSATPPLQTRYVDAIRSLPPKLEYTKSDICTNDFLVFQDRRLEMFYAPFDSINRWGKNFHPWASRQASRLLALQKRNFSIWSHHDSH